MTGGDAAREEAQRHEHPHEQPDDRDHRFDRSRDRWLRGLRLLARAASAASLASVAVGTASFCGLFCVTSVTLAPSACGPVPADAGEGGAESATCKKPAKQVGFSRASSLRVNGVFRTYSLFVPPSYDGSTRLPVVIVLHDAGSTGEGARTSLDVESAANGGAIFVYPDGLDQTWDTDDWVDDNRDLPFVDALITEISSSLCTSENRVFVAGYARGGAMANQLACFRGGVIRAVASHSSGGPTDASGAHSTGGMLACPGAPVPALLIDGDADGVVPIAQPQASLAYFAHADQCGSGSAPASPNPCVSELGCVTSPVTYCQIAGLGHDVWSEAPAAMWAFFAALK